VTIEERILNAMTRMVESQYDSSCVEVTSYDETYRYGGGCETCAFEYTVVEIYYTDEDGASKSFEYDGSFGTLISNLTDED